MIHSKVTAELDSIYDAAISKLGAKLMTPLLQRAIDSMPTLHQSVDLQLPVRRLIPLGRDVEISYGLEGRRALALALVASLGVARSKAIDNSNIPPSVLVLYQEFLVRLSAFLRTKADDSYWVGNDAFLKDIRIVGGYSVPCGAQDVDLFSTISRGSGLKAIFRWRALGHGWTVFRDGGPPWFSIHTDQRYTEEFNEAGWDRCYRRIAEMLATRPEVKGMVGTSWFYDPQIVTVSPRLAYLQVNPTRRGAFLLPHGPGRIHTERATQKSESRKRLFEEGKYLPTCYSLVWPRTSLIEWARTDRDESTAIS